MKKFHVGIQLYGVRKAMEADFEGTLKAVADMGYEYVEFAGYYGHTADEIKELLDKYGQTDDSCIHPIPHCINCADRSCLDHTLKSERYES